MHRTASLAVSALSALALAGGVAAAAPASATVSQDGCQVTALSPVFAGYDTAGFKLVEYPVRFTCQPNRSIRIAQEVWERDNGSPGDTGPSDRIGSYTWVWNVGGSQTTKTFRPKLRIPYNETDGFEELFHKARFQVTSNGVQGSTSGWDTSTLLTIPH